MKWLRRRHLFIFITLFFGVSFVVINQRFDEFGRNQTINSTNKPLILEYLDESEKQFLIDNNVDTKLFISYIKDPNFVMQNYLYYADINNIDKTISKKDVVKYGNIMANSYKLELIEVMLKSYTPKQLVYQLEKLSPYNEKAVNELYPDGVDLLVNKDHYVYSYVPHDLQQIDFMPVTTNLYLRKEAYNNLLKMCSVIETQIEGECGGLKADKAYYSYAGQTKLYNTTKDKKGKAYADKYVAWPGHSDNQLGLTVRFKNENNFYESNQFKWLKENAYKFGFVMRYPNDKSAITGFSNQENSFRYVGKDLAIKLTQQQITLEEHYDPSLIVSKEEANSEQNASKEE